MHHLVLFLIAWCTAKVNRGKLVLEQMVARGSSWVHHLLRQGWVSLSEYSEGNSQLPSPGVWEVVVMGAGLVPSSSCALDHPYNISETSPTSGVIFRSAELPQLLVLRRLHCVSSSGAHLHSSAQPPLQLPPFPCQVWSPIGNARALGVQSHGVNKSSPITSVHNVLKLINYKSRNIKQ